MKIWIWNLREKGILNWLNDIEKWLERRGKYRKDRSRKNILELIVEGKKREVKIKDGIKNNMYVIER